jgi:hAT family C-terminal dimerisation region
LFFLALAMHPHFASLARLILEKLKSSKNINQSVLTYTRLVQATLFYYQKHRLLSPDCEDDQEKRAKELNRLKRHMLDYLLGRTETKTLSLHPWLPTDDDPVAWWHLGAESNSYPELSRFGCFLLSCPVQSASCERLFKEFARQHTKSRNRLSHTTVFHQSVVVYDMQQNRWNNPQAKINQSTNRFLPPKEHPRVDSAGQILTPTDGVLQESSQGMADAGGGEEEEEELAFNNGYDESSIDMEGMMEGEELADYMVRILGNMEEENDDEEAVAVNIEDVPDVPEDEDPFESVDESKLDPLPDNNVTNFKQEDAHYFRRKNYVRNDKYDLEWFFLKDVEIPKLMDLFKDSKDKT